MPISEIIITAGPTSNQVQYLEDRIYEFNSNATGIADGKWLAILVRDEADRIVAGIAGIRGAAARKSASYGWRKYDANRG
jgi:hypothetical protein